MKELIDRLVKEEITSLLLDDNIVSIFVVGSMASDNYVEKKNNDYDIRFIVREMNSDIYSKINVVLEKLTTKIKQLGIGCEYSDLIGPVKITSMEEKNVLLHALTMTEKDVDNLSNLHKYSYSQNYQMLYGKDIIKKYKSIVITDKDIVNSTEGIDYCIDLLKNKENAYSYYEKNNNNFTLKQYTKPVDDDDLVMLIYYSYEKAYNNIKNMILTNGIKADLNDFLEFTNGEKKLIDKIKTKSIIKDNVDDTINTAIKIMLKLKKACVIIYNSNKKKRFYDSLEWGIINEESNVMRENGLDFLKEIGLPVGDNLSIKLSDYEKYNEKVKELLNNDEYIVLFEPPNNSKKRYGFSSKDSTFQIDEYITKNKELLKFYTLSLIEKIKPLENSYVGTVLSDGLGNTCIEILTGTCDNRELTSRGADRSKTRQFIFDGFDDYCFNIPKDIKSIKKVCQYFKGYYEFTYGSLKGEKNIYFTFYSKNDKYINYLNRGGKIYGKTL